MRYFEILNESLSPVVYHGGKAGLTTFRSPDRSFPAWFTDEKEFAQHYAKGQRGGAVYSARLKINRPLDLSGKYDLTHSDILNFDTFCEMAGIDPNMFDPMIRRWSVDFETINDKMFYDGFVKSGYDCLIIDEQGCKTYAVIDSSQVVDAQRINESAKLLPDPEFLYHCTPTAKRESIKQHGLDPRFGRRNAAIYLAIDEGHAMGYDNHHDQNGDSILLRIDVSQLDKNLLKPDDMDLPDMLNDPDGELDDDEDGADGPWWKYSWQESLNVCGQCVYEGVVPVSAIKIVS